MMIWHFEDGKWNTLQTDIRDPVWRISMVGSGEFYVTSEFPPQPGKSYSVEYGHGHCATLEEAKIFCEKLAEAPEYTAPKLIHLQTLLREALNAMESWEVQNRLPQSWYEQARKAVW